MHYVVNFAKQYFMKQKIYTAIILLSSLTVFSFSNAEAQTVAIKTTMPPFRILLTSQKYLKAAELDKNAPAMIVYFDPTCEHCKIFTADLVKHKNEFSKTQIIMISYTPLSQIKKFETDFKLAGCSNIKVGTEGYTFIVQKFYNIQKFPFTVLFNKKGNMISYYRDAPAVSELVSRMKKG